MSIRKSILIRFAIIYIVVAMLFGVAIFRIVHIQTVERDEWLALEQRLQRSNRSIAPNRGNIYTHDMKLLASTTPYYYVVMDTRVPALHQKNGKLFYENIDSLAYCLSQKFKDRSAADYKRQITQAYKQGEGKFRIYPKKVTYADIQDIKQMPLFRLGRYRSGLIPEEYTSRINPFDPLAKRTIGAVYADTALGGAYGFEKFFDTELRGQAGIAQARMVGTSWQYIPLVEPIDGMDIVTTLDIDIQDITSRALLDKMRTMGAERGCAIVMDVKTGEIKACANLTRVGTVYLEQSNMAVSDMSEPGSTFKAVSMMVALEEGIVNPTDTIDTSRSKYVRMTDTHPHGKITVAEVIARSSNIGISTIIDEYYAKQPEKFVDAIYQTKIQEPMSLQIPGAATPNIRRPNKDKNNWSKTALPWMSIGYETQIPPIYTLRFYNAIANNGKMINPYFVKAITNNGQVVKSFETETINSSICSKKTLHKIQDMLKLVVTDPKGTAYQSVRSRIVSIAGKTGTAQINYGRNQIKTHQASFCGYFPTEDPQYSCIVVILSQGAYGAASGEVFKNIAERIYAHDTPIQVDEMLPDSTRQTLPYVKNGYYSATRFVLNELDIDFQGSKADWITTATDSIRMNIDKLPLIDNLVPNVVGMGAKDAVYLMEKVGLNVHIYGRGTVINQSLAVGSRITKGSTVILTLK